MYKTEKDHVVICIARETGAVVMRLVPVWQDGLDSLFMMIRFWI